MVQETPQRSLWPSQGLRRAGGRDMASSPLRSPGFSTRTLSPRREYATLRECARDNPLGPASIRFDTVRSDYLDREDNSEWMNNKEVNLGLPQNGGCVTSNHLGLLDTVAAFKPLCLPRRPAADALELSPRIHLRSYPTLQWDGNHSSAVGQQGRFGSSEASWVVKNCFQVWRGSSQKSSTDDLLYKERDVLQPRFLPAEKFHNIHELQHELSKKDNRIAALEQELLREREKVSRSTRREERCENIICDLEQRNAKLQADGSDTKAWVRLYELEERHSRLQEGHNNQVSRLEEEWSERLREAEDKHAAAQDSHAAQLKETHDYHDNHVNGLQQEWTGRLRTETENREATLREIEQGRIDAAKSTAFTAILALTGGNTKATLALYFHGWARGAERAALERAYESQLREAETQHRALEQQWDRRLSEADEHSSRVEREWDARLRDAENERERLLTEEAEEKRQVKLEGANKAAFAMIGGNSRGSLIAVFAGWAHTVQRLAYERELDARLQAAESHKAELTQEHDMQMQILAEERHLLEAEHNRQLNQLAQEEGSKLRSLESDYGELQDSLDRRIQQHEDDKMQLMKEHDDEREDLLKKSKALAMMHRSAMGGAAHTIADKHQRVLVAMEIFVAWSQLCTHLRWHRTADEFEREHSARVGEVEDKHASAQEEWETHLREVQGKHSSAQDELNTRLQSAEEEMVVLLRQAEDKYAKAENQWSARLKLVESKLAFAHARLQAQSDGNLILNERAMERGLALRPSPEANSSLADMFQAWMKGCTHTRGVGRCAVTTPASETTMFTAPEARRPSPFVSRVSRTPDAASMKTNIVEAADTMMNTVEAGTRQVQIRVRPVRSVTGSAIQSVVTTPRSSRLANPV